MRSIVRAGLVSAATTSMLAAGGLTTSATAQPPINVGNLVNVNISNNDVDVPVTVTVPINAAANICGVEVNLLATELGSGTFTDCRARGNQTVTVTDVTD